MEQILAAASIIGAIVLGATQMIKQTSINNKWLPFLNVLIGIVIGVGYALSFLPNEIIVYAWAGGLAGMAATGGHVIVSSSFKADNVDLNTAKVIKKWLIGGVG